MSLILEVIKYLALVAVFGTMVYARGLYLELQKTKAKLKKAEDTIKELTEELQDAYCCIEEYNSEDNAKGE